MEGDESAAKKDAEVCYRERVAKTYNEIVARKEHQLAKEAQFDRRCLMLTKHFMKDAEQQQQQVVDDMREASQRSYDRSMQRVHSGYASEAMMKEMVREEKNQIGQLMSMKAQQREAEEERRREQEEQRLYYREARSIYDRMQKEERQKDLEKDQKERKESIQKKLNDHDDRCKELLQKKAEDQAALTEKFESQIAKVTEARKEQDRQLRKTIQEICTGYQEKEKAAQQKRQKYAQMQQETIRQKEEERRKKVLERQQAEEQEKEEKIHRILAKGPANRSHESSRNESHAKEPRSEGAPTSGEMRKRDQEEKEDQQKGDADRRDRSQHSARGLGSLPKTHRDLAKTNVQVQKEYIARSTALNDAATDMRVNKKFKKLEDLAEGATATDEDLITTRLKAVHQSFVIKKPKEQNQDVPISTRGSRRPVARTIRMLTCGLCEREFPPEHMVGSALRRTVERLRHQSPNAPKYKAMSAREKSEAYQSNQSHHSEWGEENGDNHKSLQHGQHGRGGSGKNGLYDYEVKLCVNCDIFVRIAST